MFESYPEYLQSSKWAQIRARIFARDSYRCQCCSSKAECVHHRKYSKPILAGDPKCMHFLISLCHSCHKAIEFTDNGDKIVLPAHKEQRLNTVMLTLASKTLKEWTNGVLTKQDGRRRRGRGHRKETLSPEYLNGRPIRQITVHDLARTVESLTYDMQRMGEDILRLRAELSHARDRLALLPPPSPSNAGAVA